MWDPAKYDNLRSVSVPSSSIWVPDVILFNSADGKYEVTLMTRANVSFDGKVNTNKKRIQLSLHFKSYIYYLWLFQVMWEPPAIFKSSCTINVEFFPFDVQLCTMKVSRRAHIRLYFDLIWIYLIRFWCLVWLMDLRWLAGKTSIFDIALKQAVKYFIILNPI